MEPNVVLLLLILEVQWQMILLRSFVLQFLSNFCEAYLETTVLDDFLKN